MKKSIIRTCKSLIIVFVVISITKMASSQTPLYKFQTHSFFSINRTTDGYGKAFQHVMNIITVRNFNALPGNYIILKNGKDQYSQKIIMQSSVQKNKNLLF